MRIAYIINQYPKTSHTFIRREIRALEALGFEIERVSIRPPDNLYIDKEDEIERSKTRCLLQSGSGALILAGFKCLLLRPFQLFKTIYFSIKMGNKSERGIIIHLIYVMESCLLFWWTRKWKIKHIHAHFGTNSTTVALFCRLLGGPGYSFTSHGPEEYDKPFSIGLAEKIKYSAFTVSISNFSRSQLYRWSSLSEWDKIIIVHCGVDKEYLKIPVTPIDKIKKLVCVGRICEQKGQQLLVQAAAKVIAKGLKFELVLVGDGEMRGSIENLTKSLNVEEYVKITGWADQTIVKEEIISSRGLVLPSFAEGLPVVIMEAFALGRPVISTYIAGIPELVRDKENGWLCPAGDIDSLVTAIEAILKAKTSDLNQMGNNGRKLILKNHDAEKEALKLKDAILNFVNNPEEKH